MEDFSGVVSIILAMCFIGWFAVSRRGSGRVASEARRLEDFERLELANRGTVILERGEEDLVTVKAEDNLLPKISSEVINGTLSLGFSWSLFPFSGQPSRSPIISYTVTCRVSVSAVRARSKAQI